MRTPYLPLSRINPVHDSHSTSLRSILILASHLRLGSGLLASDFPNTPRTHLSSTRPAHLIILNLITRMFGKVYRIIKITVMLSPPPLLLRPS
jgi:hypothetical protein